ncbi:MAG: hypothetical protein BMS9Abin37_0194 [Acidobacteriota bacterium]|nr:MAG: hypothetical protein BMS9Abin37_0194 [Acidobacteriota bacterium]
MRFPGSKLLSQDLSTETTSFDSIIRHCEDVNLSGYMEIAFGDAEGLLLFYLGEQINIIYRQGNKIFLAGEATLKLRNTAQLKEGKISIYELPLDMAHMLRGLSNRKEIFGQIFASDPLKELTAKLKTEGHTGSLEVLTSKGTGMILQVRGRFSTAYFETEAGVTFEKKEALNKIYELLDRDETVAQVFQSDFSPDIWKSRQQGGTKSRTSRLQELLESRRDDPSDATIRVEEQLREPVAEIVPPVEPEKTIDRTPLQEQILSEIHEQTPSLLAAFFFDLRTEEIDAELVTAPEETADRLIVDKLPAFVKYLENLAAMRSDDHMEILSMSTENFYLIVKCIRETDEGIALITDRSQPVTLASALLLNSSHRYVAMLAGTAV